MKNDMNMKTIKTWTLLVAGLLLTAGCANDDAVQQKETDNGNDKNLTTFVTGAEPTSRTSMDYASPLNTTSANVTTNGAYMLIKPGTRILKIRYWVKDVATNVEGTITKNLSSFNYAKNTYYDMAANLDVKDYDGDHYYMWDAKKQYWDGWEWTKNLPDGQPTLNTNSSNNYPQSNSDPRYYNNSYSGFGVRNDAQTALFKTLPNVNEMVWYAQKGSPRKDGDELWTTMGHLHKGGIWFKKKASISGFDTNLAPDGYDWRVNGNGSGWGVSQTLPSASEANQFFYLPALGRYYFGQLDNVGDNGYFWSSSAYPFSQSNAFGLSFFGGNVYVDHYASRTYGYRAQTFK